MTQPYEDRRAEKDREPADIKGNRAEICPFWLLHMDIRKDCSRTGTCCKHAQLDNVRWVNRNTQDKGAYQDKG